MAMTFKCKNSKVSTFTLQEDTNQDFAIDCGFFFFFYYTSHPFVYSRHSLTLP